MKPICIVIAGCILTLGFILFTAPEASVRATEVEKKFISATDTEDHTGPKSLLCRDHNLLGRKLCAGNLRGRNLRRINLRG